MNNNPQNILNENGNNLIQIYKETPKGHKIQNKILI